MDGVGDFGYDGSFLCCYRCRCFFDDDNYVVKLITHVDRLKVRNRLSAIAIDNYDQEGVLRDVKVMMKNVI